MNLKLSIFLTAMLLSVQSVDAGVSKIESPDGNIIVNLDDAGGKVTYRVDYAGKTILEQSPLGLVTKEFDFSKSLKLTDEKLRSINETYTLNRSKKSAVEYKANEWTGTYTNADNAKLSIVFRVSNNDIAFKYVISGNGNTGADIVEREVTGFDFPSFTTTFLSPQATPMIGFRRSKPSYEEEYKPDEPVGTKSKYGLGYTFPALFHVGDNGWALISETGVSSLYCGSKLSEGTKDGLYSISYPEPGENNGVGSASPAISLPGETPWRTITVGKTLKPVVETTVPFDVVSELYKPSQDYKFGRGTWSWIMWQDNSCNYDDQVKYIDLASNLGYEYILIDAWWDKNIGYDRMEKLISYAKSKNVDVFLWYNSDGYWNDVKQSPKNIMCNTIARKKEMKWLQEQGVKGLKVDFFGGDKQETMKLYEDILSDANDYGLMIIFHGCTLPRGWERMYPNYVGSEAVLASENLIFSQHFGDNEAYNATLHPFIRNAVGSMEFGPVLLNKRLNRGNNGGTIRRTTDVFEIATSIIFQNPVQMFAIAPNNLHDTSSEVIDFMKNVPTTWSETVFIDGYPGEYVVLARKSGGKWYIAAANAEKGVKKMKVRLPMVAGRTVQLYNDKKDRTTELKQIKINKNGELSLTLQPDGAAVIVSQ